MSLKSPESDCESIKNYSWRKVSSIIDSNLFMNVHEYSVAETVKDERSCVERAAR